MKKKKYVEFVAYRGQTWRVISRSDSGIVTIQRGGEKAVVLEEEVTKVTCLLPF